MTVRIPYASSGKFEMIFLCQRVTQEPIFLATAAQRAAPTVLVLISVPDPFISVTAAHPSRPLVQMALQRTVTLRFPPPADNVRLKHHRSQDQDSSRERQIHFFRTDTFDPRTSATSLPARAPGSILLLFLSFLVELPFFPPRSRRCSLLCSSFRRKFLVSRVLVLLISFPSFLLFSFFSFFLFISRARFSMAALIVLIVRACVSVV